MYQLKTRQVCFFIIAFFSITKLFSLPSLIARYAHQDIWISALISILIDFLTLIFIVYICKIQNKNFFEIIEDIFGKKGAKMIAILYLIYFSIKAILPLNEQKDYIDFTLYTLKPTLAYFLPIFFVAFYVCLKNFRLLGRLSDIFWLVTINGFLTLISLALSNADFSAILPIGTSGIMNILKGSFYSLNWFGDSLYIMFFVGQFKFDKKAGIKIILSFLIATIMILVFMVIFYSIFTSIAFRQRFALTEISKYTSVISNLGRFDYIGIILILFSTMFAISLPIFFSSTLLNYIFSIKKTWIAPTICVLFQLSIMLFLNQYFYSIEKIITNYFSYYFLFLGNILPIIISLIVIKEKKNAIKKS